MLRGVKPLEMVRRYFLCSSPSWLMNSRRVSSTISRSVPGAKRGIAVFSKVENTSLVRREISLTSSCLVTTQYPWSSKPSAPGSLEHHRIGSVRRR